jgi:hypothetical protein
MTDKFGHKLKVGDYIKLNYICDSNDNYFLIKKVVEIVNSDMIWIEYKSKRTWISHFDHTYIEIVSKEEALIWKLTQ